MSLHRRLVAGLFTIWRLVNAIFYALAIVTSYKVEECRFVGAVPPFANIAKYVLKLDL